MQQTDAIVCDPDIMMGKPTIRGTRITVELLLEKMAAGDTVEDLLEAYPHLTRGAVLAALEFAARVLRADVVYPFEDRAASGCSVTRVSIGEFSTG